MPAVSRRARWMTSFVLTSALVAGTAVGATGAATRPGAHWVIRIATETASLPDWAYPIASADHLTTANVQRFEQLLYRPLYFFGGSSTVQPDAALSLAFPPVYSHGNTTVSVTMKPGREWSNGDPVTAQGVMAWLNLVSSFPGAWGDYLAPLPSGQPLGIPDDVRNASVVGNTITLSLASQVNPTWFTENELSQITPLPSSWDVYEPAHPRIPTTGPTSLRGTGGNFTASVASAGCYSTRWVGSGNTGPGRTFLDPLGTKTVVVASRIAQAQRCVDATFLLRSLSADTRDYTTSGTDVQTTWRVSDGPWRLATYNAATRAVTMVPNLAEGASGSRPTASALSFVPCAGPSACESLLSSRLVDQGTLDWTIAPRVGSLASVPRSNPLAAKGYRELVDAPWATTFMPYNFNSRLGAKGHAGMVFRQLYVRQALQELVNQPQMIRGSLDGYGVVTDGPVPTNPSSPYSSGVSSPYRFSVAKAAGLLASHGWHVAPGKVATCVSAKCGTGIPRGTPLAFTIDYAPSSRALGAAMSTLRLDAGRVGIRLTLVKQSTAAIFSDVAGASASWDFVSWDGGWQYQPDYYPSGEWVFAQGSPWNVGHFDDVLGTSLVLGTLKSRSPMASYTSYLESELPVVWLPSTVGLVETRVGIRSVVISPIGAITPESWRA